MRTHVKLRSFFLLFSVLRFPTASLKRILLEYIVLVSEACGFSSSSYSSA